MCNTRLHGGEGLGQRVGVGQPDILRRKAHQPPRNIARVLGEREREEREMGGRGI